MATPSTLAGHPGHHQPQPLSGRDPWPAPV